MTDDCIELSKQAGNCMAKAFDEGFEAGFAAAEGEASTALQELRDAAFDLDESDPAKWMLTRAAELLEQRHPAPVAVSERLPDPGVKVLAHYFNELGKGRTICAIWVPAKSQSVDDPDLDDTIHFLEYDEVTDNYYLPEGWYEAVENSADLGYVKIYEGEIIYWQSLPKWPAHDQPRENQP